MLHIFKNNCPHCNQGKVFKANNVFFSLGFSKMNEVCDNCGFRFEKEPGYFFGAMYLSYGLGTVEGLLTYFICQYILSIVNFNSIMLIIGITITLLCFFNFRLSRILWIRLLKDF